MDLHGCCGSKGVLALDKAETALLPLSFALNDKAETALLPLSFALNDKAETALLPLSFA